MTQDSQHMTAATLRTIREALGFTAQEFADYIGVNRSAVRNWEAVNDPKPVPDDVQETVAELHDWMEETIETALDLLDQQDPPEGTPIDLYRYATEDSARRAGVTVPLCLHSAAIGRIAVEVLALGYVPVVHYVPVEG